MRNNIFERLQQHGYNIGYEICKIHDMFTGNLYHLKGYYDILAEPKTIEEMVSMFSFHTWEQRGSLLSLEEFKNIVGIGTLIEAIYNEDVCCSENNNEIILYLEYMLIVVMLAKKIDLSLGGNLHCDFKNYTAQLNEVHYRMLVQNILLMIDKMNLESHVLKEDEKIILVEKNATVTAVAEIVSDDLFCPVIEYNHHLLRGNIIRKREILKKFADDLEPRRKELKNLKKTAEDSLFYMFNKLNIRHNNNDIKEVANMNEEELENWYDEIYQLVLYCYLILENNLRIEKLKNLQSKIENR